MVQFDVRSVQFDFSTFYFVEVLGFYHIHFTNSYGCNTNIIVIRRDLQSHQQTIGVCLYPQLAHACSCDCLFKGKNRQRIQPLITTVR